MKRSDRGFTLAEVLVAIMAALILLVLFVPMLSRGSRHQKVTLCTDHLKEMHRAQEAYRAKTPGLTPLGIGFWMMLQEGEPPLVDAKVLRCPFVTEPKAPEIQYLGPSKEVVTMKDDGLLGCDFPTNHSEDGKEGGNILRKSGEVITDHTGLWPSAVQGGCRR